MLAVIFSMLLYLIVLIERDLLSNSVRPRGSDYSSAAYLYYGGVSSKEGDFLVTSSPNYL